MNLDFIKIVNQSEKESEIEIFGTIGFDWWEDEPDKNTKEKINKKLNELKAIKTDHLIVRINSLGGSVNDGLSIHDLLKNMTARKTVYISGFTASIATVIAMAGDVVKMSDNSLFLIHKCMTSAWGANENDLEALLEDNRKVDDRIINTYVKKTGKTAEEIKTIINANNGYGKWLSPQEALEYGFVDEIYNASQIPSKTNAFDRQYFNKAKLPDLPDGFTVENETDIEPEKEPSWFDKYRDKFSKIFNNKQQNSQDMKNLFPLLCALLAVDVFNKTDKDKEFIINEDQLKIIEDKLSKFDQFEKDNKALTLERDNAKISIDKKDQEITTLKDKLAKAGSPFNPPLGDDATDDASFEATMKNDDYYKNVADELGIELK